MAVKKPAAVKKVAPKKKPVAKKAAAKEVEPTGIAKLVSDIATAVRAGDLDSHIITLDDAVNDRINARAAETAKKSAKKSSEGKSVSAAPKRAASKPVKSDETITPVPDSTYVVGGKTKLSGARVKFVRYKADTDEQKVVVVMLTDKPGAPKGKRVIIPTAALAADSTKSGTKKKPVVKK